jgi:HEPN domain-containing protein
MDEEEQWLQEDDCKSRRFRAVRVREAIELFPIPERGLITFGGSETMTALVEARLAYVNGLYFCTILSALTVMEHHLGGMLYAKGVESAKRMNFEDLLKRAKKDGLLKPEEESDFDEFRHLRNAYAHFREPSHELSSLRRSIKHDQPFDDLLQRDAQTALALLGRHFGQTPFPEVRLY